MGVEIISNPLSVSALLSGETVFTTRGYKNAGIPSITLSDGPNGVRKQAGAADHLGLNTFMDSSAVGLVMGRYRLLQGWQGKLEVTNLSERNYKMMRLAGMQALCTLSQKRNKEDKHE